MKDMEKGVKASQKALNSLKAELQALTNRSNALQAGLQACVEEVAVLTEQATGANGVMGKMEKEEKKLAENVDALQTDHESAKRATEAQAAKMSKCSKEVQVLEKQKDALLKEGQAASLESRKVDHKLDKWEKDFKDAHVATGKLLKTHHWIETEKQFFGQAGSDFDFAAKDISQCKKRLSQLKSDQDRLNKKINKKVMGMIENAESEYEELDRKKSVVLNDKNKIEKVIEELEEKKKQALHSTWIKVNRDFGSIFAMLLPGCHAKLEPPEGLSVSDGLEVLLP